MSLLKCEKQGAYTVVMEIDVDKDEFSKAVDETFSKNIANIQIPGFRKGKAPRKFIEKYYGEGFFFEKAVNESFPGAYEAAVIESGINPVDRPEIDVKDLSKDGYTFTATVTVKPDAEVSGYKGIKAEKLNVTVTDEQINSEIEKVRERNSRLISVTDRAAQTDDTVIIDYSGAVDGIAFDGGTAQGQTLKLGSNQFIPGFEEQVAGHNIGEEFDIDVKFPNEYHSDELAGKAAVFKVNLHEIKFTELPELDDDFAKDVSEFDTFADYKADIEHKIKEQAEKASDRAFEEKLIDGVLESLIVEIPEIMINNQIDQLLRDFDYRLRMQGMDLNQYAKYTGMDIDMMRSTFSDQAERQVKVQLALDKIVQLEDIVPTEEELTAHLEKVASAYKMELEKAKDLVPADELKADVATSKAVELIKTNAVVILVDELSTAADVESVKKPIAKKPAAKKAPAKKASKASETEAAAETTPEVAADKAEPAAKPAPKKRAPKKESVE